MKSSETYRRYTRDLNTFAAALHRLIQVLEPHQNGLLSGSPRRWTPSPGQEAEAGRLRAEVDLLTARAAYAFAAAGSFIEWKPRGTWQTRAVNPAQGWSTILDRDPASDVDVIFASARYAIGSLDMMVEEAEEAESRPIRRALGRLALLTGGGLRPAARWTVRSIGGLALVVAGAGITNWFGWG